MDGRFQSHPGKLGHSCQPLSWEQECYKRKCYETVRKLRYNGPNGVSPMEAYEKMMEEMKTKGGQLKGGDESKKGFSHTG